MQLRLRTKLTLVMTSLVLLVVAVLSGVFSWQLLEQVLRETNKRTVELAADSFEQVLRGAPRIYEHSSPFKAGGQPFDILVAMSTGLLLDEISPSLRTSGTIVLVAVVISTLLAAVVSRATLAPLRDIAAQLDRISAGQYDAPSPEVKGIGESGDELGLVSRKITQVGQQLRGVHEIFSTMRENMNSVMAGLEDGLLLFTRDSRAVMI